MKLWVSGLLTEETHNRASGKFRPVLGQEVKDLLNQSLKEHSPHIQGEVLEVDRKDDRKPYSLAEVSTESAAKELVKLSKERKVNLRGERIFLDLSNYSSAPAQNIHTRHQWHEDRGDRGDRKGKGGSKGEKGEKGDSGWVPRDRDRGGKGGGSGWKGQR